MCVVKRKLKFEYYKHCLEATQLENKINYLEKKNLNVDNLQKCHKEFIKNSKLILKTQQKFRIEEANVVTEEFNKIELSANDNKGIQSVSPKETYAYGTSKDVKDVTEMQYVKTKRLNFSL